MTKTSISSDHVGFPTSLMQFGESQIQEIMENCIVLFTVSDMMEHVNVWQHKHMQYMFLRLSMMYLVIFQVITLRRALRQCQILIQAEKRMKLKDHMIRNGRM